ncbi:hypothetical protein JKP88DRAFT_243634 [Tribonema minus]|uniref:Uncharacterized protein n=1 Tax=Tribonema minus TaxID=303371 RepID=A0A835Z8I7_9STRA|nr:hypothetical protein JKP88DRAFT_243634 [Tribonema minus]
MQVPFIIATITHPSVIAPVRLLASQELGLELNHTSIIFMGRALKDADIVPSNALDVGDGDDMQDDPLHFGYLWIIDQSQLGKQQQPQGHSDGPHTVNVEASSSPVLSAAPAEAGEKSKKLGRPSSRTHRNLRGLDRAFSSSLGRSRAFDSSSRLLSQQSSLRETRAALAQTAAEAAISAAREQENFSLAAELEAVGCAAHAERLAQCGYAQRGAFAALTEADLAGEPLYLPRAARRQILARADAVAQAAQHAASLVRTGLQELDHRATAAEKFTLDGVAFFATRADMAAAVAAKQAAAAADAAGGKRAGRRVSDDGDSGSAAAARAAKEARLRKLQQQISDRAAAADELGRCGEARAAVECCERHAHLWGHWVHRVVDGQVRAATAVLQQWAIALGEGVGGFVERGVLSRLLRQGFEGLDLRPDDGEVDAILAGAVSADCPLVFDTGKVIESFAALVGRLLYARQGATGVCTPEGQNNVTAM